MAWNWSWPRFAGNAGARVENKNTSPGGFIAFHAQGEAQWTRRDYAALAREGFMRNPIVHRSVRLISETASAVPWLLYDGASELDDHPLLSLLERPNARQAASWVGTPYRHQADRKGVGCDCLGLVRGVWRALYGFEIEPPGVYAADWAEAGGEERLIAGARRSFCEKPLSDVQAGDLLLFRWRPHLPAKHAGILIGQTRFIHAYQGAAAVTISALVPQWRRRIAAVFALPHGFSHLVCAPDTENYRVDTYLPAWKDSLIPLSATSRHAPVLVGNTFKVCAVKSPIERTPGPLKSRT